MENNNLKNFTQVININAKMQRFNHIIKWILFIFALITVITLNAEISCGEIVYPMEGNINLEVGTFEIWFKLDVDPNDYQVKSRSKRPIINFLVAKPKTTHKKENKKSKQRSNKPFIGFSYGWRGYNLAFGSHGATVEKIKKGKRKGFMTLHCKAEDLNWKAGEWHLLVVTWILNGGDYIRKLYVDGELLKTQKVGYNTANIGKKSVLMIGNSVDSASTVGKQDKNREKVKGVKDSGSLFTVDSFRISNSVRSLDEIKISLKKGFTVDKDTLLLETFQKAKVTKKRKCKKEVLPISGKTFPDKGKPGTVYGAVKIVKGKFASQALQLHSDK
ncbi:MAG: LamG-like jellyroll fold domain-containing protein [Verrucomicrobiota bacterium]|nr:LamG-like jellyroll fold domain-containing protein [Verrucomicrobiota bacterium]